MTKQYKPHKVRVKICPFCTRPLNSTEPLKTIGVVMVHLRCFREAREGKQPV